jgi:hypothetical protein
MSYKITISNIVLEECIEHVTFNVDTPDYNDMRTNSKNSMIIKGKIDTGEGITVLYKWALLPATNPDCYKQIAVEYTKDNQLVRKVCFSKAFVVDYSESYSNYLGVGTFTLYVRQFRGKDIECVGQTTQPSTAESGLIEEVEVAKEQSFIAESSSKSKATMSFTDRITKQKEIKDVRDDKYWNTVDQYGSTPKERLDQTPVNNGEWSGERGESKWTSTLTDVQEQYKQYGVDGIEYKDGLPDFSPISQFDHYLPDKPINLVTATDDDQFDDCSKALKKYVEDNPEEAKRKFNNKQLNQINTSKKPSGFTWHHSVESGKMELVPTRIHQNSGHYGGKNIWGGGSANR